jgi:hypothetical protein
MMDLVTMGVAVEELVAPVGVVGDDRIVNGAVTNGAVTDGAVTGDAVTHGLIADGPVPNWREVDRQLRRVAKAQASLDAEELRWLARAQELELHRELGMASMLEYAERVLGYGPKAGHERLRVARELRELPLLRAALDHGQVSYSTVRELSRKATAMTEGEWLEATRGKCLREIEELLSGHKKGDRPTDPSDPDLQLRRITLELTPPTLALFREACRRLEDELGHHLTDDETMAAMCATVLGGASTCIEMQAASPREDGDAPPREDGDASPRGDETSDHEATDDAAIDRAPIDRVAIDRVAIDRVATDQSPTGAASSLDASSAAPSSRLAPYQIALTVCPSCDRGWHDAGGRAIAVPDSTIAQAICDAQYIGHTDLLVPARAYQEVSPATARLVVRRDRGSCRVPGCRSARWLQIHHIIWREHGGSNDPRNLLCLCFAHHQAVHQRKISVTGLAPDALVFDLSAYQLAPLESAVT